MLGSKRLLILTITLLLAWTTWIIPAEASIPLNDQFKATETCEALQSIRRGTNPGDVRLNPGQVYPVTAKNKAQETHYYLRIDGANPRARWVSISCGELLGTPPVGDIDNQNPPNVLAISWQPAFCENFQDKDECESQTTERFDATNFTLHGLWPRPIYCDVSSDIEESSSDSDRWSELPPIPLSDELFEELKIKMPGVASNLHLHEWYKHGTCYSETPEEYYRESLNLLDQVNSSPVQDLFASNISQTITATEIRNTFDAAFGGDSGDKVAIECRRDRTPSPRRIIVELKLNLKGDIATDTSLTELFQEGRVVDADCSRGEVDPVGFD